MKRQRNRGRKQSVSNGNHNYESSGPDVKIKGNAAQVYDKYIQLARDASANGDRIKTENYFQHAEHYFRLKALQSEKEVNKARPTSSEKPEGEAKLKSSGNENQQSSSVNQKVTRPRKLVGESKPFKAKKRKPSSDDMRYSQKKMTEEKVTNVSQDAFEVVEPEISELVSETVKTRSPVKRNRRISHVQNTQEVSKNTDKEKKSLNPVTEHLSLPSFLLDEKGRSKKESTKSDLKKDKTGT